MTRALRLRIAAGVAVLAGAIAVIGATLVADGSATGPMATVAALAVIYVLDDVMARLLQPAAQGATFQLGECLLVVALLLLEPRGVLLVFGVGSAVGAIISRTPPAKALGRVGQQLCALAVVLAVFTQVQGDGGGITLRSLGAAALAAPLFFCLTALEASAYVRFVYREPLGVSELMSGFLPLQLVLAISIGQLAAASSLVHPLAPFLALIPIAAAQYVFGEHLRARQDRERIHGLYEAAQRAHGSVQLAEVEQALTDEARRLLHCQWAAVAEQPPTTDQWGVPLNLRDGSPRWLTVAQTESGEALDDQDQRLLEAIASVGTSALDNARLVEQIRRQALYDSLTGLPNQVLFDDRVAQAISAARRDRDRFAVMMLDLDAFRKVNDSLGHAVGDELLRVIGQRLIGAVGDVDTVARLGSDHFTILLRTAGTVEAAGPVADKVLAALRRPIMLSGHELFMTASAGVAFYPSDGLNAGHLLRNADSAMHRAKKLGKDSFQTYAQGMNELAHLRLVRESELHNALQRDELRLRYQPQIDLRSGRIVAVEALVRWEHPVLGLISPAEFVPLAEESGLIVTLDNWVLAEATATAASWSRKGLPDVRMAVNLSGRHFQTTDKLYDSVTAALAEVGLDPRRLELEVTESIAVGEEESTARILQRIRDLGVGLAVDDFGTGYSMLSRLQRFPIDRLKIDQSFISEIQSATAEAPIVAAIIAMARSLRIDVVAEGVETLHQQMFLRNHGCDHAQGYLFSPPVEAAEIEAMLRKPSVGFNVAAPLEP